jgi:hypothetical protein
MRCCFVSILVLLDCPALGGRAQGQTQSKNVSILILLDEACYQIFGSMSRKKPGTRREKDRQSNRDAVKRSRKDILPRLAPLCKRKKKFFAGLGGPGGLWAISSVRFRTPSSL